MRTTIAAITGIVVPFVTPAIRLYFKQSLKAASRRRV